jgi:hypothetical protein
VDIEVIRGGAQGASDDPFFALVDVLQWQAHVGWQFEAAAAAERVADRFLEIAARTTLPFGESLDLLRG